MPSKYWYTASLSFFLACLLILLPSQIGFAQQNQKENQKQRKEVKRESKPKAENKPQPNKTRQDKKKDPTRISGKRKKQLMQFVKQNHPQLESLLKILDEKRPDKYQQALQGLNRDFTRLEQISGNKERYQEYLSRWKLKSRIDLMAARTVLADTPENREKLEQLLQQEIAAQKKKLETERERLKERLIKVSQAFNRLDKNAEAEIEKRMQSVLRKSRAALGVNNKNRRSKKKD